MKTGAYLSAEAPATTGDQPGRPWWGLKKRMLTCVIPTGGCFALSRHLAADRHFPTVPWACPTPVKPCKTRKLDPDGYRIEAYCGK